MQGWARLHIPDKNTCTLPMLHCRAVVLTSWSIFVKASVAFCSICVLNHFNFFATESKTKSGWAASYFCFLRWRLRTMLKPSATKLPIL